MRRQINIAVAISAVTLCGIGFAQAKGPMCTNDCPTRQVSQSVTLRVVVPDVLEINSNQLGSTASTNRQVKWDRHFTSRLNPETGAEDDVLVYTASKP